MQDEAKQELAQVVTAIYRQVLSIQRAVENLTASPPNRVAATEAITELSSSEFLVELPQKLDRVRSSLGLIKLFG